MVEIQCLVCGKDIKIPKYVNTEDYDGQIVCQECTPLLHIKLAKGRVQKYKLLENKFKEPNSLTWLDIVKSGEEWEKKHKKDEREGTKQ